MVKVPVLDHLRGCAALAVCLFHFTEGQEITPSSSDPIRYLGSFGWLGVEVFFVISGFVIPYSLYHRPFQIRDRLQFLARRLKRLDPPYFASIVLIISLQLLFSLKPGFRGESWPWTGQQLMAHVGYANAICGYPWLSPVFWTLAIEFQYYLLIVIVFPFIVEGGIGTRVLATTTIACLGLVGPKSAALLPHWLPLFAIGIVTFQVFVRLINTSQYLALLTLTAVTALTTIGAQEVSVAIPASLAILLFRDKQLPRILTPLAWIGIISYSLYLVHLPIGGQLVRFANRLNEGPVFRYIVSLPVGFIVSIGFAVAFWLVIERPSQMWAKSGRRMDGPSPRIPDPLPSIDEGTRT